MSRMMTTMVYGKCRVYKKIFEKFVQCNQSDGCDEIKRGWKISNGKSLRGMNKKIIFRKIPERVVSRDEEHFCSENIVE